MLSSIQFYWIMDFRMLATPSADLSSTALGFRRFLKAAMTNAMLFMSAREVCASAEEQRLVCGSRHGEAGGAVGAWR